MDKKKTILTLSLGIIIIILSIFISIMITDKFYSNQDEEQPGVVTEMPELPADSETPQTETPVEKEYVPIVFIGKNSNGDEVYKVVKREYDENIDGTKLRFALTSLILGPNSKEKQEGIYSEVPSSTNVLHIYDKGNFLIVDLSSGFSYGGGTESIYKRLFQLIKTVLRNSEKPAYLYIDGKQADVIGGDGIMISQPLSENSIGE